MRGYSSLGRLSSYRPIDLERPRTDATWKAPGGPWRAAGIKDSSFGKPILAVHSFSKRAYKGRNIIERRFCRLKDFKRVATRYDKLARNFLAAVHLAAIVAYWIN